MRGATVLGFVGAGGIGQDLMEAIRKFYYSDVSAILVMIIVGRDDDRHLDQISAPRAARQGRSHEPGDAVADVDLAAVKARHPRIFVGRLARATRSAAAPSRRWPRSMSALSSISTFPGRASGRACCSSPGSSRDGSPRSGRPSCDLSQCAGRDAGDFAPRHADWRAVRAAARHSRGAQRDSGRAGCACRSSASSTSCAASTR